MPELWNNLAAAIMRSRSRYCIVSTRRGQRYFGQSRMNLTGLVVHGLSAMSIYIDIVFVRILIGSGVVAASSLIAIAAVTIIRIATNFAVPGWATTVVGDLMLILLQTAMLVIATTLMVLSNRSSPPIVPLRDHSAFLLHDVVSADRAPQLAEPSRHEL